MKSRRFGKLQYNAPVILTFSLLATGIRLVSVFVPDVTRHFFMVRGTMSLFNPLDYVRLFSHSLGHANWGHLFNNLTYLLLLGPILEEKYGSLTTLLMMAVTALCTGLVNILFFSSGAYGASDIVFMLIILASIVNVRQGTIPLTFVLVVVIFIGNEMLGLLRPDTISQTAHIIGGALGAVFGFILARSKN